MNPKRKTTLNLPVTALANFKAMPNSRTSHWALREPYLNLMAPVTPIFLQNQWQGHCIPSWEKGNTFNCSIIFSISLIGIPHLMHVIAMKSRLFFPDMFSIYGLHNSVKHQGMVWT